MQRKEEETDPKDKKIKEQEDLINNPKFQLNEKEA